MDVTAEVDTELRRFVAAGEHRRAAALLVERYADDVYGVCRSMVGDGAAAEDLSQDVFGRAFVALGEFRGDSPARTWLLRIAKNRCIDHLRATHRTPWSDEAEPDQAAGDDRLPVEVLESREDAQRALGCLAESERALVVLRFGHGLEYAELAQAFGLREGTVRMRVSRAVAKMRDALASHAPPGRRSLRPSAPPAPGSRTIPAPPPIPSSVPPDAPDTLPPPAGSSSAPPPEDTASAPPAMRPPALPRGPSIEDLEWSDDESQTPTVVDALRAARMRSEKPAPPEQPRESWWQTLLGVSARPSAPPPVMRFEAPPALRARLLDRAGQV